MVATCVWACSPGWAQNAVLDFKDPGHEQRYYALIKELRCLVCQNQNLADSNAELAQDLRAKVYEKISSGETDDQIVTFMVDRYGDFVLYRPPLNLSTLFLWVGPFTVLLVCVWLLVRMTRHRNKLDLAEMNPEQKKRIRHLLEDE